MEKSSRKGVVRNRYAKVHPVVDRMNVFKDLDIIASNISHRRNEPHAYISRSVDFSVDSYARQLQSDFESLLLSTNGGKRNEDTKLTENAETEALENSKMAIGRSPEINSAVGKTKKHKHRGNREKKTRWLFVGLTNEILNILKFIVYVLLLWPLILSARLILAIVNLPVSALRIFISKLSSLLRNKKVSCKPEMGLKRLKNKQEISKTINEEKKMMKNENEETLNSRDYFSNKTVDSCSGNRFVPQKGPMRSNEDHRNLEMMINYSSLQNFDFDNSQLRESDNHPNYSFKKDVSSDRVSEKYSADNKLNSTKDRDKRKSIIRQHRSSLRVPDNCSYFNGGRTAMIDRNRLHDSKNSFPDKINDSNKLSKKCSVDLSDAMSVDFSLENKLRHVDSRILNHNNIYSSDKFNARSASKNSTTFLVVDSKGKKRCEKSKVHTVSCPPLKPRAIISENKSTMVDENRDEKLEEGTENFKPNRNESFVDSAEILREQKCASQHFKSRSTIVEPIDKHEGVNKLQEAFLRSVKNDPSKNNDERNSSDNLGTRKVEEFESSQLFYREFGSVESKSESAPKDTFEVDIDTRIEDDEPPAEKVVEFSTKSLTTGGEEEQKGKERRIPETVETGNRKHSGASAMKFDKADQPRALALRPRESSKSVAEFTKPIDAKSKWLEMKRKFYGNDYKVGKSDAQESDEPHPQNFGRIASISKLPAQKIFQYNMLVGRARQMRAESSPLPEKNPCGSSSALRQFISMQTGSHRPGGEWRVDTIRDETALNAMQNSPQSAANNFHRLSQTRSLSQWPSNPAIRSSRAKKFSGEDKPMPKPKPRNHQGGSFDRAHKIAGGAEFGCRVPRAVTATTRINSSLSSSDVRMNLGHMAKRNIIATKTERFTQRAEEKLLQLSDGGTDDWKSNEIIAMKNRDTNIPENVRGIV